MSNLESERLDRIEQHLRLLKQDGEERASDIKEIKQALIGSALNDYKGLVWKVSDIDDRVQKLEEQESEIQVYIKQAKVLIVAFAAAMVTLIVKAFTK
jgi:hypothetical protein